MKLVSFFLSFLGVVFVGVLESFVPFPEILVGDVGVNVLGIQILHIRLVAETGIRR